MEVDEFEPKRHWGGHRELLEALSGKQARSSFFEAEAQLLSAPPRSAIKPARSLQLRRQSSRPRGQAQPPRQLPPPRRGLS